MKDRNIAFIINPISPKNAHLRSYLEKRTKREKISFQIFPAVASGDYSFLRSIVREQEITDVVIAGGDGTVSQVVGSLVDCDVNFGIIPSGSGNGLAYAARIPKLRSRALDVIFKGDAAAIDAFYINDHFACMLCGLGLDAGVAHTFAGQHKRGLATYARLAFKHFLTMKKYRFLLQLQDVKVETNAYFISVANSNQFGNNFTIAPKASLTDGLLDIVIVTGKNKISFIWQTLKQLAGWNRLQAASHIKENKGLIYFQTDQLTITNLANAPLHIDGDPAETVNELNIHIKNKCFRLLQPV